MKHVEAHLSARKDGGDICFPNCGGPVKLVQTCLYAGTPYNAVFTAEEVL